MSVVSAEGIHEAERSPARTCATRAKPPLAANGGTGRRPDCVALPASSIAPTQRGSPRSMAEEVGV